ncbi:MAG: RnfH family protein [Alphaproteobacteria bacterium CG_4_10_14_0_2_um_filter_63_37]|nr:MAG: hypothetical protein AUJ55_06430 [Proteobacteria bacterium CG1_02_64_396]PJA25766.1 MAG: RnfH family protein [Alphaproteobacteria bacterium CG_4_10_14_0_2_um_filter_63_37]
MKVSVAYATSSHQEWREIDLPEGSNVLDAVTRSGVLELFPEIDLETQKLGVFGKVVDSGQILQEGDRVEIYRPLPPEQAKAKPKKKDKAAG